MRADTALAESGQKRGDRVNRSFAALHRERDVRYSIPLEPIADIRSIASLPGAVGLPWAADEKLAISNLFLDELTISDTLPD